MFYRMFYFTCDHSLNELEYFTVLSAGDQPEPANSFTRTKLKITKR